METEVRLMERENVQRADLNMAVGEVNRMMFQRLNDHGPGIFVSCHETLGVITEEYAELVGAVRSNDQDAQYRELVDIAVACLFGMASIRSGKMHW
jgi:NTP pyrophosphatase (non-canonical NTP hydrolase)